MMIRISITAATFEAFAATLPLGSVGYERTHNDKGERQIWLEPRFVDRLAALRGPGESYSDVILRLAEGFDWDRSSSPLGARCRPSTCNWASRARGGR